MSYVQFIHSGDIVVDVPVNATWNLPVVGSAGQTTITLPRGSAAIDSEFINPRGHSRVRIYGDDDADEWNGFITKISERSDQVVLTAIEWWRLLFMVPVPPSRRFRHVTPDVIVDRALSATGWQLESTGVSGPDIRYWEFNGETVWDHISRMMEQSSQELGIAGYQRFLWGKQPGTVYDPVLLAPDDLVGGSFDTEAKDVVSKVTAISSNLWYTAVNVQDGWEGHAVVKESLSAGALAARAENELIRRSEPVKTISGTLAKPHQHLGLGDTFSVFVPYANLGEGVLRGCRIVSRTKDDSSGNITAAVQMLTDQPTVGVPVGAGTRGGKFVQEVRQFRTWRERGLRYQSEVTA